jgi:sigma-E factor negative regulatory protein RseB
MVAAQAGQASGPPTPNLSLQADKQLLQRIDQASRTLNYSGTYVYQQGATVRASRITHMVDKQQAIEKLEVLDGKPHEIIRVNDDITTYLPHLKTVIQQRRLHADQFPALLLNEGGEWHEAYALKRLPDERVAGHECDVLAVEPRDGLRYGYRLAIEKKSGLLLRAQTLNEKAEILEQTAFTEIKIHLPFERHKVAPTWGSASGGAPAAWRHEKMEMQTANVQQDGWAFKSLPLAFKKIMEVRRPTLAESVGGANNLQTATVHSNASGTQSAVSTHTLVSQNQAPSPNVLQVILSDGLAAVSMFIEPYQEGKHLPDQLRAVGATHMLARKVGDFCIVVVGDVPAETIRKIANAIEYKSIK